MTADKKRIRGWMAFDWAQQPFYTLGLTFVFGPYFAGVAAEYFAAGGLDQDTADARATLVWSAGQMLAGLVIAVTAPLLGAFADNSGRKIPWIMFFSVIYVVSTASLWGLTPDGANLFVMLFVFYIGFIASESALNFVNAILPSLGDDKEVGRISGSGAALGYWGGVLSLFIMLLLFVESSETGLTFAGIPPILGLEADQMEGTRFVGPFIAIWYVIFVIPFFLYNRDTPGSGGSRTSISAAWTDLKQTLRDVLKRKSLLYFLLSSMFYRDALNAMYAFGGVYAKLVLGWETMNIGIFGIISAITAAIVTYFAGRADERFGPKPVIRVAVWVLIGVAVIIVSMSRDTLFWITLPDGSPLPDYIFFVCGALIGGAGGALYTGSRSMMVRHTDEDRPTEAFGLFALTGKATAFLAPAAIAFFAWLTQSVQLSFLPVIILFITGLILLRWVNKNGDRPA